MEKQANRLSEIVKKYEHELLADWMREQLAAATWQPSLMSEAELRHQCEEFLSSFTQALQDGDLGDISDDKWREVRQLLESVARVRGQQGFTPSETAIFVFSLKQPIFAQLQKELKNDGQGFAEEIWSITTLLDKLGLYTTEAFQRSREEVIRRQQQEMLELSTPVVKLWDGILSVPLIGTLDSARTQIVMESLLQRIVESSASIVIIDITGVPTVDTLVAQHLIKTVSAARLMGTDCIISGIRPQIAQTIVHLGVDLRNITTKATLADALLLALQRTGYLIKKSDNR